MVQLGRFNNLTVMRQVEFGVYLDGGKLGGILLPSREVPEDCEIGDDLYVFVYLDSDDLPVATLRKPRIQVGEFAQLKVAETNRIGAFLEWGLPKQLFLPYAEQVRPLEAGQWVVVHAYLDNSQRLAASAKVEKFLRPAPDTLAPGQAVELFVWRRSELGYLVIVNQQYQALLQQQDLFREVRPGMRMPGYIKQVREDGKVDVMLDPPGYGRVDPLAKQLLNYMDANAGVCPLNDKSSPEQISALFGVSKKAFKMAVGQLLKQGLIKQTAAGLEKIN